MAKKDDVAAQLAARCGNAGISTVLVDASRRSALCTLLDIPPGPGLSDVLKDEAALEDVVIPVQGGTFVLGFLPVRRLRIRAAYCRSKS